MKRLVIALIALLVLFSFVQPVRAEDSLRVFYTGNDGSVKTALELAKFTLVDDPAQADVIVLNGVIPDSEMIRSRVAEGAGLVLILGVDMTEQQVSDVLGMPLVLRLGTGELWLSDLDNPLQIDLDAATVYGSDLVASSLEISSQTANVDLSLDGLSDALILDVGVGDLSVELPAGPYALEVGSGLGEVRLWNVEQAPDAGVDVVMRTGAGDVSLTGTATSEP